MAISKIVYHGGSYQYRKTVPVLLVRFWYGFSVPVPTWNCFTFCYCRNCLGTVGTVFFFQKFRKMRNSTKNILNKNNMWSNRNKKKSGSFLIFWDQYNQIEVGLTNYSLICLSSQSYESTNLRFLNTQNKVFRTFSEFFIGSPDRSSSDLNSLDSWYSRSLYTVTRNLSRNQVHEKGA